MYIFLFPFVIRLDSSNAKKERDNLSFGELKKRKGVSWSSMKNEMKKMKTKNEIPGKKSQSTESPKERSWWESSISWKF